MATVEFRGQHATSSRIPKQLHVLALVLAVISRAIAADAPPPGKPATTVAAESTAPAVLWREHPDIATLDLRNGPGGAEHAPQSTTFTFVKEDLDGTAPKFVVKDEAGVKWKIKLGPEAKPETVATRLIWAAGYIADEDYFLPTLRVTELPAHLHRGRNLIGADGTMRNARLKRDVGGQTDAGPWRWKQDPFLGTRELNGLRVLMALINNWDLKDVNNSIYQRKGEAEQLYLVHDVGATFGTTGVILRLGKAKGNLHAFTRSHFITRITAAKVDFATPGRPTFWLIMNPPRFFMRLSLRSIGHNIPRADAKWMGELLGRLTPQQIRDAFQAASYSPDEVEGFARTVEERIAALRAL